VSKGGEIAEEDLHKLPYLKAVILEGLRRHPPAHFLLPHAVTEDTMLGNYLEDTMLGNYLVPKDGSINFLVAEMGRDPAVWNDPMEFRP
ncbi:cytochrome P450, partial [Vibrio vulnificus]|nr:cytochrome P450 [Vibrio vulnificus]